jgi:hypothetical protein
MGEFIDKATSFAKAMAAQVAAGFPMANKEEQKGRHDICAKCPFLVREGYRCGVCKCFLEIKVPLATSYCPKGYWGPIVKNTEIEEDKNNE